MGLNRGRQCVRGFAVRQAIIHMKCETRMSNTEIAEEIGRSRQWVGRVWRTATREAEQAAIDPEKRDELIAWVIYQVTMTIVKAQNRVEEHAAYGTLVLKGLELLRSILGMNQGANSEDKSSLHEIAKQVDIRLPLVLAKLGVIDPGKCDTKK